MLAVSPGEGDYFRSFSPPLRTTLTRLREREELEKNIVYKEISHYICHYAKVRCEAAFPPGQGPAGLA